MFTSAAPWFKKDEKVITFIGNYMEVYIPEYYEEKNAAEMVGSNFRTLGILNFAIYDSDKKNKIIKRGVFNLPVEIVTSPSSHRTEELDLVGKGKEKYTVLEYYKMDVLCNSVIPCSIDSFSLCLNILLGGKLPNTIPYDAIIDVWANSFVMNGADFDIPDLIKEFIIAQIYRDPKNYMNTFGSTLAKKPNGNQYDYITMNPRELTSSKSVFNGIVFEDMDRMLTNGVVMSKKKKGETISPMEQVLKF